MEASKLNDRAASPPAVPDAREDVPSRAGALVFRFKAAMFQLRRAAENSLITHPRKFPRVELAGKDSTIIAEATAQLWKTVAEHERRLQAGKIHNLRIALRRINNLEIPAGETFSFWRHLRHPGKWQGFVEGRELREGCVVPATGGGLCQLSNALYQAALEAEFEIVERHAHSRTLPGSAAEVGRDATVFWNYVDLRLRHSRAWRIEAAMTTEDLIVRFCDATGAQTPDASKEANLSPMPVSLARHDARDGNVPHVKKAKLFSLTIAPAAVTTLPRSETHAPVNSCEDCGVHSCFRHIKQQTSSARFGRTAFLVDEYWPEFNLFIESARDEDDLICVPLDGARYKQANYAWSVEDFRTVKQSRAATLRRAWASRRLAAQGAARQKALLHHSERLALDYARSLSFDVTRITVALDLLPLLWREGHLGGRTFDVLMTRLPLATLHERLDKAARTFPESRTLADFRGDAILIESERQALRAARRIITPHAEIARLFPEKSVLLEWHLPKLQSARPHGRRIVFPASTVGRKGAYEMRAAAKNLNLKLTVCGAQIEGEDFWREVEIERRSFDDELLNETALVVLPAHVEHKPRRLLHALARGVPVIASEACGLQSLPNLTTIPTGDTDALCRAIKQMSDAPCEDC